MILGELLLKRGQCNPTSKRTSQGNGKKKILHQRGIEPLAQPALRIPREYLGDMEGLHVTTTPLVRQVIIL